ncbi:aromatic-ring-hydroxylating dioxygenase subunit beta [Microbacterium sp. X-17]|uniref:aromatic-ring-hydroxylating dioxygenase subunit beta n=1 Tax=Microbacterium sp. X-17 TaxID=3144404 RepID=UPI0031F56C04
MTLSFDEAAVRVDEGFPYIHVSAEQQHQITQFYYHEARLLDEWRWSQWLALFAEDVRYWMPLRRNRLRTRSFDFEIPTKAGVSHMDENHHELAMRVKQLESSTHWSEQPPSRTRHVVSNLWVENIEDGELTVRSYFIVYRNRSEIDVDIWAGQRQDVLRPNAETGYKIARRTILLDQAVITSKNLSVPF